jgi:hypothetical protein
MMGGSERCLVAGLVKPEARATRQREAGDKTIAHILDRIAGKSKIAKRCARRLDVVAHHVNFVACRAVWRMHGHLRRRHLVDHPAVTGIYGLFRKQLGKQRTIGRRVFAEDNKMRSTEHHNSPLNVAGKVARMRGATEGFRRGTVASTQVNAI